MMGNVGTTDKVTTWLILLNVDALKMNEKHIIYKFHDISHILIIL